MNGLHRVTVWIMAAALVMAGVPRSVFADACAAARIGDASFCCCGPVVVADPCGRDDDCGCSPAPTPVPDRLPLHGNGYRLVDVAPPVAEPDSVAEDFEPPAAVPAARCATDNLPAPSAVRRHVRLLVFLI